MPTVQFTPSLASEIMEYDVLVVGAGPTGLMLANELALAGIRTIIIEKMLTRSGQSRATVIQPRSAEVLELRGWLESLQALALPEPLRGGNFAGLPVPLDCRDWNTRYPYCLPIPQPRLEAFLEEQLAKYLIPVLRGYSLEELEQDREGVTAKASGPTGQIVLHTRYLVGCDGSHSLVRKLIGVNFPGQDGQVFLTTADLLLKRKPNTKPITFPARFVDGRMTVLVPYGDIYRLFFSEPNGDETSRTAPVTEAEIRETLQGAYGSEVELQEICWASRFSDVTRQAEHYREQHVLLAGDAAHIHLPTGGQGLNLGLQDAFNLGWKLAAQIQGWGSNELLDSYERERHPIGARVLQNTRAQALLMDHDNSDVVAFVGIFIELMKLPDTHRYLAGMMSGLDIHYEIPAATMSIVGERIPDVELQLADKTIWLSQLFHAGHGLLLNGICDPEVASLVEPWSAQVDYLEVALPKDLGAQALLIRPDGYICWAAPGSDEDLSTPLSTVAQEQLQVQLSSWFGPFL